MQRQVVTEGMLVLSTLVTNIATAEIEEEGTEVANSTNLNCSIVEVVDMEDKSGGCGGKIGYDGWSLGFQGGLLDVSPTSLLL